MEKINIAKLLKNCPKGMELDCTMYDKVTLIRVDDEKDIVFPIIVSTGDGISIELTKYGQYTSTNSSKCVIFPKGKTTWEGFQRPFKDGDVVTCTNCICSFVAIFKEMITNMTFRSYVSFTLDDEPQFRAKEDWANFNKPRLATEEEKQKLFDAIKANGYKWNPETKTLEKLIVPKFKVGDRIKHKLTGDIYKILFVLSNGYGGRVYSVAVTNEIGKDINIEEQDNYELVPDKFDITTLNPFDKVLVRDTNEQKWTVDMFSFYDKTLIYPFVCIGHYANQCIPYEGNKHLLGTTNDCDEYFKNWN